MSIGDDSNLETLMRIQTSQERPAVSSQGTGKGTAGKSENCGGEKTVLLQSISRGKKKKNLGPAHTSVPTKAEWAVQTSTLTRL